MKYLSFSLILLFSISFLFPTQTFAVSLNGPVPNFAAEEEIYLNNNVKGDTFLIGQSITVNKPIDGDLFIIGESVSITAPVDGDVRVLASRLEIRDIISGSLSFITEKTYISAIGEIEKDAYGVTSDFTLSGRVGRELNLVFTDNSNTLIEGNIAGNFYYSGEIEPNITDKAFVGGSVNKYSIAEIKPTENEQKIQFILGKIWHSLSLIFIAWLFLIFKQKGFEKLFKQYKKEISANSLYGILALLVVPLALILMAVTLIALPLALISGSLLFFVAYISPIFPATFIGQKLLPDSKNLLVQIAVGIFIFDVVSIGPGLGVILYFFSIVTVLGLISRELIIRFNKRNS